MIITCPNCSTRYLVAEDKIGDQGRRVRCAKCSHVWFQDPPPVDEPVTRTEGAAEQQPAMERPAPPPPPPPQMPGSDDIATRSQLPALREEPQRRAPWWLLIVAIVIIAPVLAGVAFYDEIMLMARGQSGPPPATEATVSEPAAPAEPVPGAEATVAATTPDLVVTVERSKLNTEQGLRILEISGTVYNPASSPQDVPLLSFDLLDGAGQIIDRWTFELPFASIDAGATEDFVGTLSDPPDDLARLRQKVLGTDPEPSPAAPSPPAEQEPPAAPSPAAP